MWAFVPALRRVRAVSPANRSDGYLGSDISGDDGFFFDGKPEDFEWKLVGKRDGLRIVDPDVGRRADCRSTPAPGGGWKRADRPQSADRRLPDAGLDGRRLGADRRRRWRSARSGSIEATPRDKYYLYGRIELWIDAETWDGAWNRKFSWDGELVHNYQMMARVNHPAGGGPDPEWLPVGTQVWACAENFKMNRATLGGLRADPQSPFYRRMPIEANLFDSQALTRFGK